MELGLRRKWRAWICDCVFTGSLFVLANGSLTHEINIQKELKQGDPLVPFHFLLVVEWLSASTRKAENLGEFFRFRVRSSNLMVSHL